MKREIDILAPDTILIVDIEADYGIQAPLHETYLNESMDEHPELRHVCVLREDNGRSGVRVRTYGKELMIRDFEHKLNEESVRFYKHIVTVARDVMNVRSDPEERRAELIGQLRGFVWVETPASTPHGKARRTATGKVGGNNDDVCMALLHSKVAQSIFNSREGRMTYREYHAHIGAEKAE